MAMYNEITVTAELTNTEYMITKNYNLLQNKPQINSVELMGNKSLEDLGINPDAEENVIDTVKVNGSALTPDADKAVDVTITTGTNNGTVKVNGTDVNVKGLKSAAYTESSDYDVSGAAAIVQWNVDALATVVNGKVDKVSGKGLSQNDYTNADKTKLAGIQAGAQVNTVTSVAGKTGAVTLNKSDVGLVNVDNTSDANKPVSNATQTALNLKVDKVAGKGLSTEDFTTEEKTKLAGISSQANKVEITPVVTEGTTLATISIDGVDTDIKGSDIDVDSTLSPVSPNPVQNKVITATLEDKADKDGNYEDMAVGQLLSNTFEEDKTPYNFRTAGGTLEIGDREYDTLVGGTVAFNQLVNGLSSFWSYHSSISYDSTNKELVSVCTQDGTAGPYLKKEQLTTGHKYLLTTKAKADKSCTVYIGAYANQHNITANYSDIEYIFEQESANIVLYGLNLIVDDTLYFKNVNVFDLTQMFGSTIADYIYSLEQATAGSGVAYFRSLFPKDYYAYNAGELMSVKALSHKMVGFNQWDEEWRNGYYNTTGKFVTHANNVSNKNPIAVIPNTTYYLHIETSANGGFGRLCFYDKNGVFVSTQSITGNKNYLLTIPSNAYYLNFDLQATYGKVYNNDICINLHWDGERDREYEAYEEHIYPLDSDLELRGIPKLDANNKLYYDGDTYESDGTVTRKYGVVDLGTLGWTSFAPASKMVYMDFPVGKGPDVSSGKFNGICDKYVTISRADVGYSEPYTVIGIGIDNNNKLFVTNPSSNWTSKEDAKSALSGVYLVYELATPTTETADTFTNPQLVDNWGTEEYTDSREVQIPVGHITKYPPDLKAKLESAPDSPSANGDYILRHNNGVNTYVADTKELPAVPTTDGTYVLKATVSSGTATLSWVAE